MIDFVVLAQGDNPPAVSGAFLQYGVLGAAVLALGWLAFYFIRDALRQRDNAAAEVASQTVLLREIRERDVELLAKCQEALRDNEACLQRVLDELRRRS